MVVNDLQDGMLGHVGIAVVFGLVIMAMIYSYGNISGAHFNPAVTISFFAAKRISGRDTIFYIISQISGGLLGGVILLLLFPEAVSYGTTNPSGGNLQAFVLEVILTFILMTVILNVSTGHMEKGIMAGIAIGGTVALASLFGGPISGASMNPARSIAPAIVSGDLKNLWIYLVAPIIGSTLAIPFLNFIQGRKTENNN
jgi:aquaporin Z